MDITNVNFTALREPFKAEDIQWRIIKSGKSSKEYAIVAAYVDNRAIMERLDTVVGIPHWESRFTETVKGMICQLSICGVTKSDGADYTNIEPTKGGISDAMKRAGSQWGIGQYLYKLDTQYAIITPNGSHNGSYKIKENGKDVIHYFKWNPPKLPDWALPKPIGKKFEATSYFDKAYKTFCSLDNGKKLYYDFLGSEGYTVEAEIPEDKAEEMKSKLQAKYKEIKGDK
jgi:hypothetical protein